MAVIAVTTMIAIIAVIAVIAMIAMIAILRGRRGGRSNSDFRLQLPIPTAAGRRCYFFPVDLFFFSRFIFFQYQDFFSVDLFFSST